MAKRLMDETGDGFLGAQTTENVDRHQDVSTPPSSDQMEVDELDDVADNEAGGSVELPNTPKLMTPVSCLNEICVVRKLSIPQYQSRGEVGVAHMKIFTMEAWVRDMELRETGHGRTKMEAKHKAATRVLDKLRAAGERNESLNRVTPEVVKKCHEMLKKFALVEPQSAESESEKTRFSAASLRAHEMARGMTPSVYDSVYASGPPHNRIFTMSCKQGNHITHGTGKSKQIGKNIAASHMLNKILSVESSQANAQQQQQ